VPFFVWTGSSKRWRVRTDLADLLELSNGCICAEEGFSRENEAQNVSTFMMFFQQMLPELFAYFEDEEVGPNDWAVSWIRVCNAYLCSFPCSSIFAKRPYGLTKHFFASPFQFLLAKELPMDCVLRLWDTYFSCAEGLGLHLYTMLAILVNFHEELIELEQSELKGFLQHLPEMDMDQVLTHDLQSIAVSHVHFSSRSSHKPTT